MKQLAYYSIVRFMPFAETEEFVNAGVVLLCPKTGYFDFQLAHRRQRVSHFFERLDSGVYKAAIASLKQELLRLRAQVAAAPSTAEILFAHLTDAREALLRFRAPRAVMTDDPAQELADKFAFYVEHDFANKEYQDRLLNRAVRKLLTDADLAGRFAPHDIGNDDFHLGFPLVRLQDDKPTAAIKPLYLGDDEPTRIYDKGTHWAGKLRLLRQVGGFGGDMLFALQAPQQGMATHKAFENAREELREAGAQIVLNNEPQRLVDFARTH